MTQKDDNLFYAPEDDGKTPYHLRLFIAGTSPNSVRASNNLHAFLEEHLKGNYTLEIIDVRQQPALAKIENVTAIPMLIKHYPAPKRILIGDMSDTIRVKRGTGFIIKSGKFGEP